MLSKESINNVGPYKIRKSGNSDITTVPKDVKEALNLETGDQIEYIIDSRGIVILKKKTEKQDMDVLIEESVEQYHVLLEELVEK
ncbi:AbrB/MazE/SpoVT family DNA-binding domain-containing protein [Alkalibacterium kapii]|uniref:AbrB family transcriptional regulator n=1 Tax=Alkalibacterium kapii TaxID=426704 RepID=A0A511AZV1_9LACT|nr:type II toxin-antitoxin system PrlF family antitoxin [Alkalibacterium kapii]GEK91117.1 AbrB family transcriptional regulator [Alkalibacterium kapii]